MENRESESEIDSRLIDCQQIIIIKAKKEQPRRNCEPQHRYMAGTLLLINFVGATFHGARAAQMAKAYFLFFCARNSGEMTV